MSSSAISAQGSTLHIGTGSGGAVTLTAIALGYPTILTKTSHGLSNGDVVTLSNFAGTDAATLNSQVAVVHNVTANTFAVNIDTTGKTINDNSDAAAATPVTWTQVKEIKSFSGFDGAASEIDITNLDSTAKEFKLGLQDFGGFKCDINVVHNDAGQAACAAAKAAGTTKNFKLTLPNAEVGSFTGLVKAMPAQGGVDGIFAGSIDIKISGTVTWA